MLGWLDIETTGLSPATCTILEVGLVVTDNDLNVLAAQSSVVKQSEASLDAMDAWCRTTHEASKLLEDLKGAQLDASQVGALAIEFLMEHGISPKTSPMCGSTIHFDRAFLAVHMPALEAHFHYRNCDVSTVKGLVERWYPSELQWPKKKGIHRALPDILDSIAELKWYRERVFRNHP